MNNRNVIPTLITSLGPSYVICDFSKTNQVYIQNDGLSREYLFMPQTSIV